ncbi:hypothetical protein LX16_0458 [Stackebrandtia albiflava]|uniref:Uncharacterized protein n=1 Tax=Stackebrandtia albiflava TaxID=406432 RepID=A0A562VA92_9ACTN|nr:hypothetical protein LX16_0458 [Stackebrandtia albiflava]
MARIYNGIEYFPVTTDEDLHEQLLIKASELDTKNSPIMWGDWDWPHPGTGNATRFRLSPRYSPRTGVP